MKIPFFGDVTVNKKSTPKATMPTVREEKPVTLGKPLRTLLGGMQIPGKIYEINLHSSEIDNAVSVDPLLARGIAKYIELIMAHGMRINGDNSAAVKYVQQRVSEIMFASTTSLENLMRTVSHDLIAYGNAFVVFKRSVDNTSGHPYMFGSDTVKQPISGMFIADPRTIKIMRNPQGEPVTYQQDLNEEAAATQTVNYYSYQQFPDVAYMAPYNGKQVGTRTFDPNDVLHIYYNKLDLSAYGRSFLWEVLDDVAILRDLEYVAYEMVKNKIVSIGVYTVGTKDAPATDAEIQSVMQSLELSPDDPMIIIPERHDFKLQTVATLPDITNYIKHFQQKVYTAFGLSGIAFSEGGTSSGRATADIELTTAYDRAREFQHIIADAFNTVVIPQILKDGGYPYPVDASHMVTLEFPEPDVDLRIKEENQILFLYEHNAITFEEMRNMLGLPPLSTQQIQHLHLYEVTEKQAEFAAQAKEAAFGSASEGSNETNNKVQPENQHGKKQSAVSRRIQP